MADAVKDANGVAAMTGVLNTNGTSIVRIKADPITHLLEVGDGTTGTDHGPAVAIKDGNSVATLMAVSSVDGKTPVVLYVDSSGNLLVDSS